MLAINHNSNKAAMVSCDVIYGFFEAVLSGIVSTCLGSKVYRLTDGKVCCELHELVTEAVTTE